VSWQVVYTKQAQKDAKKLAAAGLKDNVKKIIEIIKLNPWQNPPSVEKLVGDLNGAYSRRISIRHRLVYEIIEEKRTIKIIRMWTHYE
jgi:Txe/YoeB family toxin of toxin-antitoxin system